MKFILTILLSFFTLLLSAKNIYISSSGSDGANGLTPATAWQTIGKLNSSWASIVAGDSILFKRGDVFYGSIVVAKSGTSVNPIKFNAYGTGAKPLITGSITLSSWTLVSTGIYQANSPLTKSTVNLVTIDGIPQQLGRYPNANAANGGYLTYTSFSGNTSITGAALPFNFTGAELVLKSEGYIEETAKITNQSGNTLTYDTLPTINPRNDISRNSTPPQGGFGYFIQKDARTLDVFSEWYFDNGTKNMKMFFGSNNPASYTVKISAVDTLLNFGSFGYFNVGNMAFEGANLASMFTQDATNITVQDCDFNNSGAKHIFFWNTPNVLIERCNFNYALCGAVDNTGRYADNTTVRNCTVKNTATFQGMGNRYDPADMKGIHVSVQNTALVELNTVDTTGYVPIQVQGSNWVVQKNIINYYDFVKDDGGGVYTYTQNEYKVNRTIQNNIISNAVGSVYGNALPTHAEGVYTDGNSNNVKVLNNTIYNTADRGIYNNDPRNVEVRGNTTFNCGGSPTPNNHNAPNAWGSQKHYGDSIYSYSVKRNVFYSLYSYQNNFNYNNTGLNSTKPPAVSTIQQALQQLGSIDSNVYNTTNNSGWSWYYQQVQNGNYTFVPGISLSQWQSYSGQDLHSTRPTRLVGSDSAILVTNPTDNTAEITLGANYTDVYGNAYNGSISMLPFTGIVLLLAAPTPPTTPTITSFSPTTGYTGLPITINGTNFTGATAVSFGGTSAASFTVDNANKITAYVANGATGSVSVTTPAGSFSLGGFTYTSAPTPTNCNCMILYNVEILPK